MNNGPIRIILVDDNKLLRDSLKTLLGFDTRFIVIADCDNGHDAIEKARQLNPDVLLLDINMSPLNGFEVTEKLLETDPTMKVIGISMNNQASYATKMIELGARGFVTKNSPFDEISHAIIEVHDGRTYICKEIRNLLG